ncbi:MAG: hypothetical protein PF690_14760 [Deltaproteobacteria bacterium]|nr:hypothetical protein [Deltaproteobacteria bacterium]
MQSEKRAAYYDFNTEVPDQGSLDRGASLLVKEFAINSAFEIRMIQVEKENKTFKKIMDGLY